MPGRALRPAKDVHVAAIGPDLVVLDLRTGDYACLPGLAGAGRAEVPDPLVSELLESGLFERGEPREAIARTSAATRTSRDVRAGRGRAAEAAQVLGAVVHAAHAFQRGDLQALVERSRAGSRRSARDPEASARRAVLFDRWLPWIPGQGACLWRAYLLRRFLQAGGLDADWIFGVRTCPFSAHCWLQSGDLLLDDDLDRVGLYTPILAV